MSAQLNYMIARQRSADLQRVGERPRLATEVPARRRRWRDPNPITRPNAKPWRRRPALEVELMEPNEGTRTSRACDVTTYVVPAPGIRSDVVLPLWSRAPRHRMTVNPHRSDLARLRSPRRRGQQLTHEEKRLDAT